MKDLKFQVVDLSVEIASKILKKELDEEQKQNDFTQKLIDEIEIKWSNKLLLFDMQKLILPFPKRQIL